MNDDRSLADRSCVPCRGGVPPMPLERVEALLGELEDWCAEGNYHIVREFSFPDFRRALDFVNAVGEVAEEEGHHPDLYLTWGKVRVEIRTHKINGLTDSDFILAAKVDRVAEELSKEV